MFICFVCSGARFPSQEHSPEQLTVLYVCVVEDGRVILFIGARLLFPNFFARSFLKQAYVILRTVKPSISI